MTSHDAIMPKYIREEEIMEVYDTDERGPGINPIERIVVSHWKEFGTGKIVTDPSVLDDLNRRYPPTRTDLWRL